MAQMDGLKPQLWGTLLCLSLEANGLVFQVQLKLLRQKQLPVASCHCSQSTFSEPEPLPGRKKSLLNCIAPPPVVLHKGMSLTPVTKPLHSQGSHDSYCPCTGAVPPQPQSHNYILSTEGDRNFLVQSRQAEPRLTHCLLSLMLTREC